MAKAKKQQRSDQAPDAPASVPARPQAKGMKPADKAAPAARNTAAPTSKPGAIASKPAAPIRAASAAAPQAPAPLIDTSLAAQAAAKLVAQRDLPQVPKVGEKRESASFKQLKESLLKHTPQGPAGILQKAVGQKKLGMPFGGRNQVGHNQTFGADVNRSGVPRRTGG